MADKLSDRPVTESDKEWAIRRITGSLQRKFGSRLRDGWSDACLESELFLRWTVSGGCYLPGKPTIEYVAAGLKVWVTWSRVTRELPPTWTGKSTILVVRELYNIPDPEAGQLTLL